MSQSTERRRHEALARETASWQSWIVGEWFTNGYMAVMLDVPGPASPMRLDFECMCDLTRRRTHERDLGRFCVFVDAYEQDDAIHARLSKILQLAQRLGARGAVRLMIDDEPVESEVQPGLLIDEARIAGDDHPHAWVALNHAYVEAVRTHARPDQWFLVGYPKGVQVGTELSTTESPMVIGARAGALVAVVMPMANNTSMIGVPEQPAETGVTR